MDSAEGRLSLTLSCGALSLLSFQFLCSTVCMMKLLTKDKTLFLLIHFLYLNHLPVKRDVW